MSNASISLNKYISQTGICSRREADTWIDAGRVKINGVVARKGNRVEAEDIVTIDDQPLIEQPKAVYIAFHKPPGITCTTDLRDPDNIIDYINYRERIFPIGRLDKASTGLILLTNDGDIVNDLLREEYQHEKEYIVKVNRAITSDFINRMSNGIPILGTVTKKCTVERLGKQLFRIILTQGLNRQIRRMCEYLGYRVISLKRIRFQQIRLDNLALGKWRHLTKEEIKKIKKT